MKSQLQFLKNKAIIFLAVFLAYVPSKAATYTATASGNWSAGATWGGTAPSFNLTIDQVIIPPGITVTMDNSVTVTGATASVAVQGTLSSGTSYSLTLGALGSLTGTGTINIGGLNLQTASVMSFSGSATVDSVTTALANFQLSGGLTVTSALNLSTGTLNLGGASSLTMSSGSTIILSGGLLANGGGGTLGLSSSYNVVYLTASATTGVELSGSGLNNLTVNVSSGNNVTLSTPTTVHGTLALSSGNLVLNGFNLTLAGNIAANGNGTINSTSASSITINTSGNTNGALNFASGSAVANLTVNAGAGNTINIGGTNLGVNGNLTLTSGNINVGSDTLSVVGSGSISGGGSTSYIIATGSGALGVQLTAGAADSTVLPVGTSVNFAPVALQLAAGSTSGNVYVTANAGVFAQGTTGTNLSLTQPMVNTSWLIEPSFTGNVNMNIQLMWSAGMQVNGFNFDSAYVSHFMNGAWNTNTVSSATLTGSGIYKLDLTGVTSFSPFAVFGSHAVAAGIPQLNLDGNFEIYPNPVSETLLIKNISENDNIKMDIINVTGQVIASYRLTNNTTSISLQGLSSGNYFARLYNSNTNVVKKFTKM